jgi:hypothetical protein
MSAHNPKHTSDRMCGDLVAARSKQWRRYFTDVHITGNLNLRPPVTRERSQVQSLIAPPFRAILQPRQALVLGHLTDLSSRRSSTTNHHIPGGVDA